MPPALVEQQFERPRPGPRDRAGNDRLETVFRAGEFRFPERAAVIEEFRHRVKRIPAGAPDIPGAANKAGRYLIPRRLHPGGNVLLILSGEQRAREPIHFRRGHVPVVKFSDNPAHFFDLLLKVNAQADFERREAVLQAPGMFLSEGNEGILPGHPVIAREDVREQLKPGAPGAVEAVEIGNAQPDFVTATRRRDGGINLNERGQHPPALNRRSGAPLPADNLPRALKGREGIGGLEKREIRGMNPEASAVIGTEQTHFAGDDGPGSGAGDGLLSDGKPDSVHRFAERADRRSVIGQSGPADEVAGRGMRDGGGHNVRTD